MAPHWKCGSGQPVAGSNPALSASYARHSDVRARVGASAPRTSGQWRRGAPPWTSVSECQMSTEVADSVDARSEGSAVNFRGRARRGTSGALNLQSAIAGLNSHPRSPFSRAAATSDVEDRVPRSGESRTVSGPEGSSTKRSSSGAAERPGLSRSWGWARKRPGRRWVHGNLLSTGRDRTGAP